MFNVLNKFKVCCMYQYYVEWMKGMVYFVFNFYSGIGCFINVSFGLQGCNSGRGDNGEKDSDDFVVMVDDFIESFGCFNFYDGNDFESGFFSIVKFFDILQVYCIRL